MARAAVRGVPQDPGKGLLVGWWQQLAFEVRLQWISVLSWWQVAYVRILQRLRLAPADLGELETVLVPA